MGKRFMANLHASLDRTCKSKISKMSTRCQILGIHSTTYHPELRNERLILISFMGFPAILSTLQPFQICIFNRKNSKLTFSNALSWWEKGLWQICMHHWTVHAKVEFQKFPPDVRSWGEGVHFIIFDPELRNKFKKKIPSDVRSWGLHSMEWAHSQDLTLFQFCCVHHHRSFLTKDQQEIEYIYTKVGCTKIKRKWWKKKSLFKLFQFLLILFLSNYDIISRYHSNRVNIINTSKNEVCSTINIWARNSNN